MPSLGPNRVTANQLPSEAAIRTVVLALRAQPGRLQEIAERFFEVREGLKFRPIGRNSDVIATKGYPDTYAITSEGRLAVAEVTAGDWKAHIDKEDLPRLKALGAGVVGLYRLLVFRDEPKLLPQRNTKRLTDPRAEPEIRLEVANACGIDASRVDFIFLKQFIREVRSPTHLQLLLDLGLPISPAPFQLVDEFIPSGIPEITATSDEFDEGLVVPEQALGDLLQLLHENDHVVVSGEGASGKTSLALAAGRRWSKGAGAALYLDFDAYDLADPLGSSELIDTGARFATERSLFILDNVHLTPPAALTAIFRAWRSLPNPPKVLSTGRGDLKSVVNGYGTTGRLLKREVTEADLLAAYSRLARRFWQTEGTPTPPPEVLRQWRDFTADLVVFCLAVEPVLPGHGSSSGWRLARVRAVEYVRDHYLDVLPTTECETVIRVAALARLEVPASLRSLGGSKPVQALNTKIVTVTRHGAQRDRTRLRLAHHNLGALILEAAVRPAYRDLYLDVACKDPFQGCYIARRLYENGDVDTARDVLRAVRGLVLCFDGDFAPGYLGTITQLYVDLGVDTFSSIEQELIGRFPGFLSPAIQDPLLGLGNFLTQAYDRMPDLYALAVQRMEVPEVRAKLIAACQGTLPSALTSLIRHARQRGLSIADRLLRRIEVPAVLEAAAAQLRKERALSVQHFLQFVAVNTPQSLPRLEAALLRGKGLENVRDYLMEQPFSEVLHLMKIAPDACRLALENIDAVKWRHRYWVLDRDLPRQMDYAAVCLKQIRRLDLLPEVARQAILRRTQFDWRPARKGARRLLAAVSALSPDEATSLEALMIDLAASSQLDRIYNNMHGDEVLGLMKGLWGILGERASNFVTPAFLRATGKCFSAQAIQRPNGLRTMVKAAGLYREMELPRPSSYTLSSLDFSSLANDDDELVSLGLAALARD